MLDRLTGSPEARRDLTLAIAVLLFAGLVYWEALKLPPPFFDPLGSAAVPKFVAGVLAVLALALLGQHLLKENEAETAAPAAGDEDVPRPMPWVAIGSVLAVSGYALTLQYDLLSFRTASILFILVLGAILARFSWRIIAWLLPIALCLGFFFNFIFTQVFYIDLPQDSVLQQWFRDDATTTETPDAG